MLQWLTKCPPGTILSPLAELPRPRHDALTLVMCHAPAWRPRTIRVRIVTAPFTAAASRNHLARVVGWDLVLSFLLYRHLPHFFSDDSESRRWNSPLRSRAHAENYHKGPA